MAVRTLPGTSLADWINATMLGSGDRAFAMLGSGDDQFYGSAGSDTAVGEDGNDILYGYAGNDSLQGGGGNDMIYGGIGNDVLDGGAGDDLLDGGDGKDTLFGGDGRDQLYGGAGDDSLNGGEGDNLIFGGTGNDRIAAGVGADQILGEEGNDTIDAGGGNNIVYGGAGNDAITAGAGDDFITGDAGQDTINAGDGNNQVYAGSEDDRITTGGGDDFITGDAGNDTIIAGNGNNQVYGGDGNDSITAGAGQDFITGDAGADIILAGASNDQVYGGSENDKLNGGAGRDLVFGDAGDDLVLQGRAEGDALLDQLDGGSGTDTLRFVFTRAEWLNPGNQTELGRLVAENASPAGQAGAVITSAAWGVAFSQFEVISTQVDGIVLSAADDPVTANADLFLVTAGQSVTGSVVGNDVVPDLVASVTRIGAAPAPGTFSLSNLGQMSFDTGNAFASLGAGQVQSLNFTYRVRDADGDQATAVATIRVIGVNDGPEVAAPLTADFIEGVAASALNLLTGATDKDNGETATLVAAHVTYQIDSGVVSGTTPAGLSLLGRKLAVDTSNAAFGHLGLGATETIRVVYDVTDVHGATVAQTATLTIHGTNDSAVIGTPSVAAVTEDHGVVGGHLVAMGTLSISDLDAGEAAFKTVVTGIPGNLGSLSIAADGAYTYA
ncbi:MAG: VCBS domain-containing protein, partial [Roseococcus sp.]